jgi:NAD(P)-dependent dehydrogenase (short-subunit alcohol dehydrogenase family)
MDFDDLQFEKRGYAPWPAYGQSKLTNQLFNQELQRRLRAAGSSVLVAAALPGWTAADLQGTAPLVRFLNHFTAAKPE